ncbi:hypothetical protein GC176_11000 [bacterium]|nr:hypothetical protein [bacterium]
MPIKFRCQQCRQFLGISRARAGEIVDCPTCGRTIRVPELDGTVNPLPEPGLKFDDTRLKHALDEIALIGDEPPGKSKPAAEEKAGAPASSDRSASKGDSSSRTGAATLDEPSAIELPPLPPPDPVSIGPLPIRDIKLRSTAGEASSDESLEEDPPWRSTAQPRDSWKQLLAAAALKEQEDWEVSQAKTASGPTSSGRSSNVNDTNSEQSDAVAAGEALSSRPSGPDVLCDRESAFLGFSTWFAIIGIIVLICSAGFWIGRSTAITWSIDQSSRSELEPALATGPDPASAVDVAAGLEGRITWKSAAGQWNPDRDACVILLPVDREGVSRVSSVGLRSGDTNEDRKMAESSLQAMGGAVGFADETGRFQIKLREPGEYFVLILSRSAGRSEGADDAETIDILSRYFDRAEQLLGHVAYRFEKIRLSGRDAMPLDSGFASPR